MSYAIIFGHSNTRSTALYCEARGGGPDVRRYFLLPGLPRLAERVMQALPGGVYGHTYRAGG